jgi:ABC-type multidrug transport system ATPase subunit
MDNLHVDSVIKTFGTRQVLTDIYLSCSKGEIVGMLGRNGSGKSTLLKIIFGSLLPDQKFVLIEDKIIKGIYDNRNLVNYLPQYHFLPNHVKASTIISLFCDKRNASLLKSNDQIKPMLARKSRQLSGGEKRLLEILLILHSNAHYLLIDEPFNGLDPLYKDYIKDIIREQSKSKGLIITDHDYRNILDVSTRVVLLHDGGIREISDINQLKVLGYIPEAIESH